MQARGARATIGDRYANKNVVGCSLRVLGDDVPVAVLLERAGVDQLVLRLTPPAAAVFRAQRGVREFELWVFVDGLAVRVGGCRVDVEINFLDVLRMIAFRIRQTEEPFLEMRIPAVPKRQREAQTALAIGEPEEPVLAPPVCARQRVLVGEAYPVGVVGRVVLADGGPLTLA